MEQNDALVRELTIDEAITVAIHLQRQDELAAAADIYRRVFAQAPDHPRALHYAGVLAHQQGRSEEGIELIERSLAREPDRADCYSNLGLILRSLGRLDDAIEACRRAIAIDPRHANAHGNLGVLLRAAGRPGEAEAAYRTAIELDPDHLDAHTNLGILLDSLRRTEEAAACYCRVITLRPRHRQARRLLALAHWLLGERDAAVKIFEDWLAEEPADPIARHMHAACTGRDVPPRASNGYIETTFDSFAASFESKLQQLSYRVPALIAAMVESTVLEPSKALDVLDAGCGTGLCGPLLAPYARRLIGVDLSEGMLAHARDKRVYDVLVKTELTAYLCENRDAFDLIVSADTLVYFGDLESVARAAAAALRPGGVLVFSLEHAAGGADPGYRLEFHGRYSHTRAYVERVLAAARLDIEIAETDLRMESGAPVAGLVVRAALPRCGRRSTNAEA
jgi:predicted TPR repeat methyltransferase